MLTTRPEIHGTFGAVASTHWLASAVGMAMLERGGNAFDAAVAAGFTLQVVEPHQNGLGGDVPVIAYEAKSRRLFVLCGQGPAPGAATIERYRREGVDLIPGTGLLAAVVPGAFDAWMALLRDHGTMRVRDVIEPAIHYARHGTPVTAMLASYIDGVRELLMTAWPSSAAVYLRAGHAPEPGTLLRNLKLADTYERLIQAAEAARGGREGEIEAARNAYYRGFVAEAIDRFCRTSEVPDSSGRRHRGLLTAADMARYEANYEEALTYDYRGHTIAKTGPWGQGPAFLQALALLKGFDLDAMDPNGADFVHTLAECLKLAMADREAYYGDPNFASVPMATLLSDEYNADRRRLVERVASLDLRPGSVGGKTPRLPGFVLAGQRAKSPMKAGEGEPNTARLRAAGTGEPNAAALRAEGGDTVNVNVIDRHGNIVSAMPSGGWLQSSPVIPELGFCLGTRAQMFWLEEGLPASLEPNKRPRTTLTPGLAFRDGEPSMAFGSPGGDGQDQWALQLFLRHVHHRMNLQQAIEAPAFLTEHAPSSFYPREPKPGHLALESRFEPAAIESLRQRGHRVDVVGAWTIGRLSAVSRADGLIKAAANPRTEQAYAIGR
ncbi:MAG: gamma-glutamyltransferase family protein [Alphaproteobacteria bacterium]